MVSLVELEISHGPWLTFAGHPDPSSGAPYDETSFFYRHRNWGPHRDDCPDIVFKWNGDPAPRGKHPGYMMYNGMVVLNQEDNPVLNHDIPLTLSSKTYGFKMQAMLEENSNLEHRDCKYTSSVKRKID